MKNRITGKKMSHKEAFNLVSVYGPNVKLIKDPTEEVQIAAIENCPNSIFYIEIPSVKAIDAVCDKIDFREPIVRASIKRCKTILKYLDHEKENILKTI